MAGDWIKMRVDLADDPAVIGIAQVTGLDVFGVVGRLHAVWSWANVQTDDGRLPHVTAEWLDRKVGTPGFAAAMALVGWLLVADGPGPRMIVIPGFERHNGASGKQRALKAEQKRRQRNVSKVSPSEGDRTETREEKRREEKGDAGASPPPGGPAGGRAAQPLDCSANAGKNREASETLGTPSDPARPSETAPDKPRTSSRKPAPRPRDPLWDAVVEVTGSDQKASKTHIGRVCRCLREAEPPYTPDEVRSLRGILQARGFSLPLTLGTVEKYIGWVRNAPPAPNGAAGRPAGNADRIARFRKEAECQKQKTPTDGGPTTTPPSSGSAPTPT